MEFITASNVVMLYGQPSNDHSPEKEGMARDIVNTLFKNSNVSSYMYKHDGKADLLLLLIIDPLIGFVQNSIYYYGDLSWAKDKDLDIDNLFTEKITEKSFDGKALEEALFENEQILGDFHGDGTVELVQNYKEDHRVSRPQLVNAFGHLNSVYRRRKKPVQRRSLMEKPRPPKQAH